MDQVSGTPAVIGGRFSVQRAATAGGMGQIYEAVDLHSGLPVAVKLMKDGFGGSREIERFTREAEMLAGLRHPGIVRYVAHGQTEGGACYLAMEWLDGIDLSHRLDRGGLTVSEVILLAKRVADALAVAHQHGIVHRDLKPSNLFLVHGDLDQVKLIDFGVARRSSRQGLTATGAAIGTPSYMSPEQARGQRDVTPAADVFSLGCILYECLAGSPPFVADHVAALLAKILFEEAPPLGPVCPHVPHSLASLIMQMLSKEPGERPADASALRELFEQLAPVEPERDLLPSLRPRRAPSAITGREQYLVTVVVARAGDDPHHALMPTLDPEAVNAVKARHDSLKLLLAQFGVHVEGLADGSLVATSAQIGNAADLAMQVARCALLIHERWPEARVGLATGRGQLDASGRVPVGEAIDRAVHLVRAEPPTRVIRNPLRDTRSFDGVLLDEVSAHLLDPRFVIDRTGEQVLLQTERAVVDETRLLLGKPTSCVGRDHELALLDLHLQRCLDESKAHAIVVTAPPGVGKSRLRHEFLRRVEARGTDLRILFGRGDPMTAGSPYGLLAQALRRACGIQVGDAPAAMQDKVREVLGVHVAPADRDRVVDFTGELCGVRFPDEGDELHHRQLRAARQDPKVMSDQVRQAFVDLFAAECAHGPVVLVLEDLHWSDGLTVKLIERALEGAAEHPFLVLALARPEALEMFPNLWAAHSDVLALRGISAKASERFAGEILGAAVGAEVIARIVKQAGGNALFLEELIRAVAEGKGDALPESVLGILQARLSRLDAITRKLVRAGAIFGARFWRRGVAELCGLDAGHADLDASLELAVEQELIERARESRFPGEVQYAFRHALMRDAAYGLLPEQDRTIGHRLAAEFLEKVGEPDPVVIADHYREGREPSRAVPFYLRAADLAAAGNDLATTQRRVERGLSCGPEGEELGALRGLQCYVGFWNDQWETAHPFGTEALERLAVGSVRWCKTMGTMLTITSLSGKLEHFGRLVAVFATVTPVPEARTAYVEAASMLVSMFSYLGRVPQADAFIGRMEEIGALSGPSDATGWGWIKQGLCYHSRLLEPDPWRTLTIAEEGARAFEEAGSTRNAIILNNFLGIAQAELGDRVAGEATLRGSLAVARRLQETLALSRSVVCLALVLGDHDDPAKRDEAAALAGDMVGKPGVNSIYLGMAHDTLAQVALRRGDWATCEREARRAIEVLKSVPTLRLAAAAKLARALVGSRRADEARVVADAALVDAEALGCTGFADVPLRLAVAEARAAAGDPDAAAAARAAAQRQIDRRAEKIGDDAWRARYLAQWR